MVFNRDIRITILGNAGVGKTTLIKRLHGEGELEIAEKTTVINVEKKKIKLESQEGAGRLSKDRYRWYNVITVDTPGDFTLRRQWRVAMTKYKADGIIFMLDPEQDITIQRSAMEDAFNYFLDSLDMNAQKADKIARKKKAIFYFVVNKIDILDPDPEKAKKKAEAFIENFEETLKAYYERFPKGEFRESYISVIHSPYEDIDKIFERVKLILYES